jgi:hypothetical protein
MIIEVIITMLPYKVYKGVSCIMALQFFACKQRGWNNEKPYVDSTQTMLMLARRYYVFFSPVDFWCC